MADLYWYDYETYGTSVSVDRPVQFVGIRTDENLKKIGSHDEFICQISKDYVPQLDACLIHGRTPNSLPITSLKEYDFAKSIYQLLTQANTCSVGFNSMRFDHPISQHLFYRNLLDPYGWHWKDGNTKWDVIDLFRAAKALRPNGFIWPTNIENKPSFKLVDLAKANNIPMTNAHDALCDIEATIELVKIVKSAQPELYKYAYSLKDKNIVRSKIIDCISKRKPLVYTSSIFPSKYGNTSIVYPLGINPQNNNEYIVYDLRKDLKDLFSLSKEELKALLFKKNGSDEKANESIGITTLRINQSPFICDLSVMNNEIEKRIKIDLNECKKNLDKILKHSSFNKNAIFCFASREINNEDIDVDQALYSGSFICDQDLEIANQWLNKKPIEKVLEIPDFKDQRLHELAFRHLARNHPDFLSIEQKNKWDSYCKKKLFNNEKESNIGTLGILEKQIEEYLKKGGSQENEIILNLVQYINSLRQEFLEITNQELERKL